MKKMINAGLLTFSVLSGFALSQTAHANVYHGRMLDSSGNGVARQVQVLTVNCPAPTTRLFVQVADTTFNSGIMSVTLFKNERIQTVSDLEQSGTEFGPSVTLAQGAGQYYMFAYQTDKVAGSYAIEYICQDAAGHQVNSNDALLIQD